MVENVIFLSPLILFYYLFMMSPIVANRVYIIHFTSLRFQAANLFYFQVGYIILYGRSAPLTLTLGSNLLHPVKAKQTMLQGLQRKIVSKSIQIIQRKLQHLMFSLDRTTQVEVFGGGSAEYRLIHSHIRGGATD